MRAPLARIYEAPPPTAALSLAMRAALIGAVTLVALAAAAAADAETEGDDLRIFGGEDADENEFPSQVHMRIIRSRYVMSCGGTLISENWVLTAAHCVPDNASIVIIFGSRDRTRGQVRRVRRSIRHEGYYLYGNNDNAAANDIALLQLVEPVDLHNRSKATARLPDQGEAVSEDKGVVVGWGRTDYLYPVKLPINLQKLDVDVIPCPKQEEDVVCTNYTSGTGPCSGDSGSALFVDGKVVGVASFVDNANPEIEPNFSCDDVNSWTVYTAVASFRDWIKKHSGI